jgi:D-alanine-D-alanine ligase
MKKTIAIMAGGDSSEYVISIQSANQMYKVIDKTIYQPFIVLVKGSDWTVFSETEGTLPVSRDDFSFVWKKQKIRFDGALIGIHGRPGEDGKLQGYFEMMGIPFTTAGSASMGLTFNKYFCNQFVRSLGIVQLAPSLRFRHEEQVDGELVGHSLGYPCFVKPTEGGSSFGISKVHGPGELQAAVELARNEHHEVLVEQFIPGVEITCGVLKTQERVLVFPVTEIIPRNEFFDTDAKYDPALSEEITPARIPGHLYRRCQEISSDLYDRLNCRGVVRIDFMLNGEELNFLEINTVPGMSENSIIPKQAATLGISLSDLFSLILEDSFQRNQDR